MNPNAYVEMSATESTHWWFYSRRKILERILDSLNMPKDAKILEVGCGTGGNLQMLSFFGNVSGMEMDPTAKSIAEKKTAGRFRIKLGSCPDDVPYRGRCFDLICMFDVLEHIEKDQEAVATLSRLLKPGGRMLITVPAYQFLYGRHDEFLHHKRRYTSSNLLSVVNSAGLSCIRITYFNTLLFPLVLMVRLKEKFLNTKVPSGKEIPTKLINKILRVIFQAEKFLLMCIRLPFGSSILCIAGQRNARVSD